MVGGWKGWLLKPVDPFLAKHGAGLDLPIRVSGSGSEVRLGLAFGEADEPSANMASHLRQTQASLYAHASSSAQAKAEPNASHMRKPVLTSARSPTAAENLQVEREQRRQMFAGGANAGP